MSEVDAAWLAAAIDGEGTISIWRERRRGNRSGFRYKAIVRVFNTNLDFLLRVRELTGCAIGVKDWRNRRPNHKVQYSAMVRTSQIPAVLRAVRPHLIIKTEQADTVLRFCEAMEVAPMRTFEDHEIFEGYWRTTAVLNRRGTSGG